MASIYKHYEAWVTGLQSDIFKWARLKLTTTYVFIIVIILTIFSFILYANLAENLHHDVSKHPRYSVSGSEENPVEDALERIETGIITTDIIVLLISGGLSYWLAGYTLKPIRKALDAQTRFSAEASHELRTPLAVMRTGTEVLLRGNHSLPNEAKKVLEANLEEINLMSEMTEQLLELSRGNNAQTKKFDRLDLKKLIKNTIEKLTELAAKKQIQLELQDPIEIFVIGKKNDLERMFKNIITNSITYTPAHGFINLTVSKQASFAEISISDNGIGIPEKDIPHIFEAFYKADQSRATVDNQPGTGLGLAIVKSIVEQHHGTIEIKSIENRGTTVIIRIPTN